MKTDIIETVKNTPLFHEFTDVEVEALLALTTPIELPPGENIVKQDDPGDCMFVMLRGRARVVHRSGEKRFELATLGPGEFFGELALVDEGPRSADVEAMDECLLLRIEQSVIRALAGVYPTAAFKLLIAVGRVLVARMRASNRKYIDSLLLASGGKD